MQIRDIMTRNVEVVHPDASLQEAASMMRSLDVGVIPVCDGEQLVGMLTDRDITLRATAHGSDPTTTRVSDVMTPNVVYCFTDQDVAEASRVMQEQQIRRLPIVDRHKRLVGIVSLGDLAVDTDDTKLAALTISEVSKPAEPER